jgi:hypothetical protein
MADLRAKIVYYTFSSKPILRILGNDARHNLFTFELEKDTRALHGPDVRLVASLAHYMWLVKFLEVIVMNQVLIDWAGPVSLGIIGCWHTSAWYQWSALIIAYREALFL